MVERILSRCSRYVGEGLGKQPGISVAASASSAPSWSVITDAGNGARTALSGVNLARTLDKMLPQGDSLDIRCPTNRPGSGIHVCSHSIGKDTFNALQSAGQ